MSEPETYSRLPGSGRTLAAAHTLWLGSDHLLAVESNGFKETYRRYLFRDIWAIRVRRTHSHARLLWTLLAGSQLFMVLVVLSSAARGFFLVTAVLALAGLFYDLSLGPPCTTQIVTAVSARRLPSLARLKRADRAIQLLSSHIAQFQGSLPPTTSLPAQPVPAVVSGTAAPIAAAAEIGATPGQRRLAAGLILTLWLSGLLGSALLVWGGPILATVFLTSSVAVFAMALILLIVSDGRVRKVRRSALIAIGYASSMWVLWYALIMVASFRTSLSGRMPTGANIELLATLGHAPAARDGFTVVALACMVAGSVLAAILCMLNLGNTRGPA